APANADYAAALRRQTQELGISQRVQFVGAVSQRRLAGYFAAARVMVLPSLSEGLPRVIVEAMMTGTPVIGTRISGIPDIIQDGENSLLISPDDADDLLRALRQIYALDVAAMAAKARSFALDFFSPNRYAAGYQQLFETALRGRATSVEPSGPDAIDSSSARE
ncbi:MAG: glycosyltransferase, partial [Chloroflexi bacterium]|nr:glycosyltransferase [Chloroflexota bacterium]